MKRIKISIFPLTLLSIFAVACSSQRSITSETDDIYYSAADRRAENSGDHNEVKEISGEDFKAEDENSYDGNYYSVGSSRARQNPNSEAAYYESQTQVTDSSNKNQSAQTINNFYGNTTYAEGDYYDDSYATRMRRFNQTNMSMGYGYYDPFFVDPYWNYGWGYMNPYPYGGWSISYNTWGGWGIGYNYGWGNYWYGGHPYFGYRPWYNQPLWYRYYGYGSYWDYWSYGYPYYGAYGSMYGPYGSPYWNGYNNGFYDGYNAGTFNGGGNQRPVYRGRRPDATASRGDRPSSGSSTALKNQSTTRRADQTMVSSNAGLGGKETAMSSNSNPKSVRTEQVGNDIYQVNNTPIRSNESTINRNSVKAASKYEASTSVRNDANKYDVSGGLRSNVKKETSSNAQPSNMEGRGGLKSTRTSTSYSGSQRMDYQNQSSRSRDYRSTNTTTTRSTTNSSRSRVETTQPRSNYSGNQPSTRTNTNYDYRNTSTRTAPSSRSGSDSRRTRTDVSPRTYRQPSTSPSRSNYNRSGTMDRSPSGGNISSPRSSSPNGGGMSPSRSSGGSRSSSGGRR